jgi:hypothetical protein
MAIVFLLLLNLDQLPLFVLVCKCAGYAFCRPLIVWQQQIVRCITPSRRTKITKMFGFMEKVFIQSARSIPLSTVILRAHSNEAGSPLALKLRSGVTLSWNFRNKPYLQRLQLTLGYPKIGTELFVCPLIDSRSTLWVKIHDFHGTTTFPLRQVATAVWIAAM